MVVTAGDGLGQFALEAYQELLMRAQSIDLRKG
jgi:hypothetical protein